MPLRIAFVLAIGSFAVSLAPADAPLAARPLELALQSAIAKAEPAIACLLIRRDRERPADLNRKPTDLDDRTAPPDFYGSGVVIDPQGLILTNYHVVRKAGRILVRLPARSPDEPPREANASIFAADSRCDLAVLKVERMGPLPALSLGEGEKLKKGSLVIALGYPHAVGFREGSASATAGVISNLRRRPPGVTTEIDRTRVFTNLGVLLQTDARLQLGSSGGALVDLDGKLVGLTTATAAITGVDAPGGFAIPIDANYRRIIEVLSRGEEVDYGFLGVTTTNNPLFDRPSGGGFYIDGVTPNSPADRAGLRRGDAILAVNGQTIREYDDLFLFLGAALAGRRTELKIQPFGERVPRTIEVTLVKYPIDTDKDAVRASKRPPSVYGLRVDYSSIVAKSGEPLPDGVLVREVLANSPAKAANLTEFVDVITHVNEKEVDTPADFYREVDRANKSGEKLRLTLRNPQRVVTLP
jgi:serine protease Do